VTALTASRLRELLRQERRPVQLLQRIIEPRDGYVLERLTFDIAGQSVRGLLTRPEGQGRHPARSSATCSTTTPGH
jgi:hypothetical protein